jgi:hypothetical protein
MKSLKFWPRPAKRQKMLVANFRLLLCSSSSANETFLRWD